MDGCGAIFSFTLPTYILALSTGMKPWLAAPIYPVAVLSLPLPASQPLARPWQCAHQRALSLILRHDGHSCLLPSPYLFCCFLPCFAAAITHSWFMKCLDSSCFQYRIICMRLSTSRLPSQACQVSHLQFPSLHQ